MKDYLRELNDVLAAYTFGDLFEAMQAVELCDQIITENQSASEIELAQIGALKSLLESIILQGSSDEMEEALNQIKNNLFNENGQTTTVEWTAVQQPAPEPEAPSVSLDDLMAQMGGEAQPSQDPHFDSLLSQMSGTVDAESEQAHIDSLFSQSEKEIAQNEIDNLFSQLKSSTEDTNEPAVVEPTPETTTTDSVEGNSVVITVDDGETLSSFVSESIEHLDSVETLIVNLESSHDHDTVNAIFRAMHTIKGVSGFMGFAQITELSHKLENLLDALRGNEIGFSSELIDILLSGSDMLRSMMNVLSPIAVKYASAENSFNVEFPIYNIKPIMAQVDSYMQHHSATSTPTPEAPTVTVTVEESQPTATTAPSAFSSPNLSSNQLGEYAFTAKKVFQNLKRSLMTLQQNIHDETAINEIQNEITILFDASKKMGVQEILDLCQLITNKISRTAEGYHLSYSDLFSSLKTLADAFKVRMTLLKQAAGMELTPEELKRMAPEPEEEEPLIEAVKETEVISQPVAAETPAAESVREATAPTPVKPTENRSKNTVTAQQSTADPEATTVRVDIKKMDKLFNMIGELITAQDILLDQINEEDESQEIQKAKNHLEKVIHEIQELSMQLRMVTLNALFNKMKRVTRDLSRKLNKEVNFTIFGQDTEMDRTVIDEISDPLMHIIRNALDHGLEDAQQRQAAGKSPVGNVVLGAKYEGNGIVISVRDDGQGLNKDKILAKAIRNGIISEEDAENIPDRKIYDLIMLPGFSTSENISDISGRGVGMDVVKRSIDALRGSISIASEAGKGSEFRIRIPLTLAIIEAITFRVGSLTFATQITDVVEFYKAHSEQITTTQSQGQVLNLRGELIPILEMSQYYNTQHNYKNYEDGIVIVASSNNKKVAVVVDEIIGNKHLVIKPLPQVFSHLTSLSGCSILAGGETCLIVDINRLLGEVLDLT